MSQVSTQKESDGARISHESTVQVGWGSALLHYTPITIIEIIATDILDLSTLQSDITGIEKLDGIH